MGLMQDFEEACREFPAFRAAVVHARDLADAGTRPQIDHLLNSLDKYFADVQQTFPKAVAEVEQELTRSEEQARKVQADVVVMKETLAKHQAAAAAAAAAAPTPTVAAAAPVLPTMAPLDLLGGLRARDELLKRFGTPSPVPARVEGEGSVAERWTELEEPRSKESSKPEVADEWPEELRTPSTRKRGGHDAAPKTAPASDDDSIGNAWNEDDG